MKIEVIKAGPRQSPFNFSLVDHISHVEVPEEIANQWKAGQHVKVDGVRYIVSIQLLPDTGQVTLWEE